MADQNDLADLDLSVLDTLTAENDVLGRAIEVGTRVRAFDFAEVLGETIYGLSTTGDRVAYMEGIVEAIGEDVIEGCPRYRIRIEQVVRGANASAPRDYEKTIFPPLNGTPTVFGRATFGVVAAH